MTANAAYIHIRGEFSQEASQAINEAFVAELFSCLSSLWYGEKASLIESLEQRRNKPPILYGCPTTVGCGQLSAEEDEPVWGHRNVRTKLACT